MQVLTGQYPTLYTHKLRLSYSDFKPSNTYFKDIEILTLPKATQVLFVAWQLKTAFFTPSSPTHWLYLFAGNNVPTSPSTNSYLSRYNASGAVSDQNGTLESVTPHLRVSGPTSLYSWNNYLNPTPLVARLVLPSALKINNTTAGEVDIWITTCKFP